MGIISNRLKKMLSDLKSRKIVNLDDLYKARKKIEEDLKTIKTPYQLGADYHPSHAVYVSTQNLVSVLAENLSILQEMDELAKIVEKSENTYMPGYPPMSPVTRSFFTFWAFFDVRFGADKETIGTCLTEIGEILQLDAGTIELIENLQSSRMGIYAHQGNDENGNVYLHEIFTHKKYKCYSASKYPGEEGEIWFVRIAPPPFEINDQYIAITTPYVILGTGQRDWESYFDRVLSKMEIHPPLSAYNELLKYGLIPNYWNEYIFQAYANHLDNAIYLLGIPDKPESLPHFDSNSNTSIDLSQIRMKSEKERAIKKFVKKQKKRKK